MHFYVTLTLNCNLQCRYCYGKCVDDFGTSFPFNVDYSVPSSLTFSVADLAKFLSKDSEPSIIFYGGEPTLALDKMREVMDNVQAKTYSMQTNGLLLDKLEPQYVKRFSTVLISLDGDETLTDYYRGNGIYRKVIENLKLFRSRGFTGEFIARMTVSPETDLYKAVNWLLFNKEFPFQSVHWQLDAQFWQRDYNYKSIKQWFDRYNSDVQNLIKDWVIHMETNGEVLRVYPLIGVTQSLLAETSTALRCGAGWIEFNIQTDGQITPCPVLAGMKDFYLGDIWKTNPKELTNAIFVKEPCTNCKIYGLCGGRCLYANATKLWGDEGFQLVCGTVENLVNSLKAALPNIQKLISNGRIKTTDFNYPLYNSCEIIP